MDLVEFDREVRKQHGTVAGVDEAGRGPLAGPVVTGACILKPGHGISGLNDSKQLSERRREELFALLIESPCVVYAIGASDPEEIDRINILQATIQAMLRAVEGLPEKPDYLLVDGLLLPHPSIPGEKVIKGDARSESIAAASILAKVTRDRMMHEFDAKWPQYGFAQHKGYGTQKHRQAIEEHGPCPIHRRSFEPIKSLMSACV